MRRLAYTVAGVTVLLLLGLGALFLSAVVSVAAPGERCQIDGDWSTGPGVQLDQPMGLAWSEGRLYVADAEDESIEVLGADGSPLAEWRLFQRPVDVAAHGGFVYVADFLADRVVKLGHDGDVVARWGGSGDGPGEFDAPAGLAIAPDASVYVSDFYHHRIQRFDPEGRVLGVWGRPGSWPGELHYPTEVAVDARGRVLVADAFNHRVQIFTPDGEPLQSWGGVLGYGLPGGWPRWFRVPKSVAVDAAGAVYVADAFNGRVQNLARDGTFQATWEGPAGKSGALRYPAGLTVDGQGGVFVSDFFASRLWRIRCGES